MPKFVTIGYGDEAGYQRTPAAAREAAHQHDAKLVADGALMGMCAIRKTAARQRPMVRICGLRCRSPASASSKRRRSNRR
jgi:hypothetical protein